MEVSVHLSAINQYNYCPRRAAIIIQECEFADNLHTLKGNLVHENVDTAHAPVIEGVRIEYALPVWSERLGLSGRCDAVEFHPDGIIYPVEHKKGQRRKWINDDLQVAAQAMCLEEMLSITIQEGAVFHYDSRRRRPVKITQELRAQVESIASELHRMKLDSVMPKPLNNHRCPQCSVLDICLPEVISNDAKICQLHDELFKAEL
ncbi:CRISPR-associated protein Cas4 [Desulfurispirillum indicum]|uniref:CRISPR-associated protein Cas4 n=1 Tax=Desulfurispirillum indicum TaxID=936456 RepID=UPI001CF93A79|nr:CRISPR-associated protein Cas4 [Desulfurispirillum indicum]UCZ57494.1 CRISPR-associated protein Cas4 [Desulfurispirillum indicum]